MKMDEKEFENLLLNGCKDNANIYKNPEMLVKYTYDKIAKQYALESMPDECAEAHREGYIHWHDLEFFNTRPNCFNADLRFIIRNGLKIDGNGVNGSVAKPAKSLEVLLNHCLQFWMAGATVFSGGQGFINFNTLLAPFAKGRSYYDIKQAIQGFIYNANMSLVCRGGQILFSNIGIDLSVPDVLKNKPAYGPEGVIRGVYGDYQEEADLIFRAVVEVSCEKDGVGKYHRFPNLMFNIREGDLDEFKGNCRLLHEYGANNPTWYYVNCLEKEHSQMGALTSDTPVMTDKGFKYPNQLNIGDNVMTYALDGSKEWNKIYNIIPKIAPSGVFKVICDNNYMFKVTNNHKLPTNEGIIKSEDLKIGMELYNYLDEFYTPTDDYEAEFIGMFLADGYIKKGNVENKGWSAIQFHVKNDWKKEAIINVCDKCNYKYDIIDKKDGSASIYVREYVLKDNLYNLYDENCVKHFPNIWDDKNKIANVIKGLMLDANKQNNRFIWSCSDLPLVIDVLYALSMIGRENSLYVDNRSGDTGKWRTNYMVSFGAKYKPKNKTKIKSIELVENNDVVYDLSIKNNANYVCGLGGIHSENCRSNLEANFTGDYELDCANTGNFAYTSINLPLIALDSEGDVDKFFNRLNDVCEIVYKGLIFRRNELKKVLFDYQLSDFLLQRDCETNGPLYDLDRTTISLGFVGLFECLKVLDNKFMGQHIIKFLNDKKDEFHTRDGLRWSVIASPAESTAHRFAMIIKEKYPNAYVQGDKNHYYLTNGSHIPVNQTVSIVEHVKNSDKYHPMTLGGNILHLWLGEVWSDPKGLWKFNRKILETGTQYWAYSKVFTWCKTCGFTINDNLDVCPICQSKDLVVMDRITGYYQNVSGFNDGKKKEFNDRYRQC